MTNFPKHCQLVNLVGSTVSAFPPTATKKGKTRKYIKTFTAVNSCSSVKYQVFLLSFGKHRTCTASAMLQAAPAGHHWPAGMHD
eukprot:SM000182S03928  [mRNA]  locus=s182:61461:61938:- [translate_table: standard]